MPQCVKKEEQRGKGPERIRVGRWLPGTYVLEVHNYSKEMPLRTSGAVVTARIRSLVWTFICPPDLGSETCEVCRLDGRGPSVSTPDGVGALDLGQAAYRPEAL